MINACYDYSAVRGYVDNEIIKMPDSPKKDAILMMLLRSRHSRWPDPARVHFGSRGIAQAIREPYTSFFKKYLPDIALDESLVATPEARLEFADRLEAAMTGKPIPPKKPPSQFPTTSQKENLPPPSPDKAATGNSPDAPGTKLPVPTPWLIATIALGAISLAWWLLKKQK